jgi:hypothetical protein
MQNEANIQMKKSDIEPYRTEETRPPHIRDRSLTLRSYENNTEDYPLRKSQESEKQRIQSAEIYNPNK